MSNWLGFVGAIALIVAGAVMYAPTAPEEPRPPEVVAEVPSVPPPPAEGPKPAGEGAPQGG
jgi:hypothetical protein